MLFLDNKKKSCSEDKPFKRHVLDIRVNLGRKEFIMEASRRCDWDPILEKCNIFPLIVFHYTDGKPHKNPVIAAVKRCSCYKLTENNNELCVSWRFILNLI